MVLLKSSEIDFDDAYIQAKYTEKSPVYIIDADSWEDIPLKLNRSFKEALKSNVDRETVERQGK